MQIPEQWCSEFPSLQALLTSPVLMLGQDWYADGRHRYRVRMPIGDGAPFTVVQNAAGKLGIKTEWNKNVAQLRISGEGWNGFASVAGGPEYALGSHLDLYVQFRGDPLRAQAGAKELARRSPAFEPFVGLAEQHSAELQAATRFEFDGAVVFGYIEIFREGWRSFLSTELNTWLQRNGFVCVSGKDGDLWTLGNERPLMVSVWDHDPDKLRVDVAGLAEFEQRPAGAEPPEASSTVASAPSHGALVARSLCLAVMGERVVQEMRWKSAKAPDRDLYTKNNDALIAWMHSEGLFEALSSNERHLLLQPVGGWTKVQHVEVSWRIESLCVIAWALGLVEVLPAYDAQFSQDDLRGLFPLVESTKGLSGRVRVRDAGALTGALAMATDWHRRAVAVERQFEPRKQTRGFFAAAKKILAAGSEPAGQSPAQCVLSPYGKPFGELSFEEFSLARSIALERRHALNWVCNGGSWDEAVPL